MKRGGGGDARWIDHAVTAEEAGRSVQEILQGPLGVSRRMIQRLTRSGGIRVNGRAPRLSSSVRAGDRVAVRMASHEEPGLPPVAMELSIVYEDADILILDKPASVLVHPLNPSQRATLAHGVAHHFASTGVSARVRPLHRLDRETSGLVVFAKSAYAHQHLDRQLREGRVRRLYLAFVEGAVDGEKGEIAEPIGPRPGSPHLRMVNESGAPALTRFRVLASTAELSMLEVELETGRTHQIRVHLAHLGHPLVGDRQYGARPVTLRRQALHAFRIELEHPVDGRPLHFEAPLPADLLPLSARLHAAPPPGGE